ncbi:putative RDD family membrane protein YckC [Streptacidiphilus sp. MAP12-33]|uniref:RDD family protein n=1 Tax=Streptacidiphilus sp. MAP12-33 TaxID=3156266 RepID=UPI003519811B
MQSQAENAESAETVVTDQPAVPVLWVVASAGSRVTAFVLDMVVMVVPLMLLSFVPAVRTRFDVNSALVDGVVWSLYYAVMLAVRGRTVGMAAVGLRVVPLAQYTGAAARDGLTVRQACVRTLVFLLPVIPGGALRFGWAVVDCAFALGGPYRQALHDRLAGTVVVHEGDY